MAPAFFGVVEGALFTTIVLWADKLFYEKGERGLFNFLTFVEYNRKWLSPSELKRRRGYPDDHWMLEGRIPFTLECIKEDQLKIHNLEALKSVRLRRDKFHGHFDFDKDYFFDRDRFQIEAPIRWKDLEEAGDLMGTILNNYSVDFDGVLYSWDTMNIHFCEMPVVAAYSLPANRGAGGISPAAPTPPNMRVRTRWFP